MDVAELDEHDDELALEFQGDFVSKGRPFSWRGIDKLRVRDGLIVEETVYVDTAPMRAARDGKPFEPLIRLPPLVR